MSDPNKGYEPIRPYCNLSTSAIFRFVKREQDCFYRSPLIWTERVFQVFQDMSGSEYSEPKSVSLLDEPTGSVHEEAVRKNSPDNRTPNLARKRHGEDNPDNAESSSPKRLEQGLNMNLFRLTTVPPTPERKSRKILALFVSGWEAFQSCVRRSPRMWP